MKQQRTIWASVLMLTIAFGACVTSYGQTGSASRVPTEQEKQILEACRTAVLELKFTREKEALLASQVAELNALNSTQAEQVARLQSAVVRYEAAITARTQAEALVSELRQNYEKQLSQAEKALAVEKVKSGLWKILAAAALVVGFVLGTKN